MKYLMACSVFLDDGSECPPIYVDIAIYLIITIALIASYILGSKLKQKFIHRQ